MPDFKLPDVGEGLTEAEIVTWKVKVGDVIKVNDIVVEIETAKSLVELPSPYAGTVQSLHVPEGETVAVGTPIITVGDAAAQPSAAAAPGGAPLEEGFHGVLGEGGTATVPPADIDLSNPASGGGENQTLVGYGPRAAAAQRRPRRGGASPASDAGAAAQLQLQGAFGQGGAETAEVAPAEETPVPAEPAARSSQAGADVRVLAKPPVRKLAKDLGVDLRTLTPSGPHGTVTREDVLQSTAQPAEESASTASERRVDAPVTPRGEGDRREPIKGVRKRMAQAMVESAFTAPHVTEWVTVDATRTMKLVDRLREHRDFREVRVSPLLVLAKAALLAMRRTPEINAAWDEQAQEVVYRSAVNLGIAAATPRGLVVPNVKGADALSLPELGGALNDLTRTAREGRTQPAQMSGGTFTITNVGVFGVDAGTPIINPGESAILCFGAIRPQPWVHPTKKGGKIRVRQVTTLALSFDHRLIDGQLGSQFLADVAAIVEDPSSALFF